jgi:phage tail tube protein FII
MSTKVAQVTNGEVWMNGNKMVGLIEEFTIDAMEYEPITHESLGMIGALELPSRKLNPMNATIKFKWIDADVLALTAIPHHTLALAIHSLVDVFDQAGLMPEQGYRMIHSFDCLVKSTTADTFKLGEATGLELNVSIVRLEIKSSKSDVLIKEISILDQINRVNGKDVWPQY